MRRFVGRASTGEGSTQGTNDGDPPVAQVLVEQPLVTRIVVRRSSPRVRFSDDTIDNELMGKKKSKCCLRLQRLLLGILSSMLMSRNRCNKGEDDDDSDDKDDHGCSGRHGDKLHQTRDCNYHVRSDFEKEE
ncbi:hypothetical protein ACOME3_008666 [Neoechinorhynchus agilis]